jgi:hypothetical protein
VIGKRLGVEILVVVERAVARKEKVIFPMHE